MFGCTESWRFRLGYCTVICCVYSSVDKPVHNAVKHFFLFLLDIVYYITETTTQAQVHEIKEDWKPSFLTNDEFMHLMLEVSNFFLSNYDCNTELKIKEVCTQNLYTNFGP